MAKVGIHSSQTAVEVLDVNGIVRRVDIFPDAAPVLMSDMRESHVPFVVIQDHEPSPLAPFITSFLMTLLVVCVVGELGMMWDLVYGIANVGIGFYIALAEVPTRARTHDKRTRFARALPRAGRM